jgi:hypothetical protein
MGLIASKMFQLFRYSLKNSETVCKISVTHQWLRDLTQITDTAKIKRLRKYLASASNTRRTVTAACLMDGRCFDLHVVLFIFPRLRRFYEASQSLELRDIEVPKRVLNTKPYIDDQIVSLSNICACRRFLKMQTVIYFSPTYN